MANTILVPLCFLAILAAVFTAKDRGCCRNKTVGAQTYGLLEEGTSSPSWPSDCPTSCIYSTFLPGDNKRYCFAPGNLTSVCTSSSGLVTSTSTTTSTTSTTSTKTTTTTAPTTTTTNDPGLPTVYSQPAGELELKKDNLLATIPLLGRHWEVTFEFKPTNNDYSGWASILHLTAGGNGQTLGDRTPAIFYHPSYGLTVSTAIGSNPNSYTYIKPPPAVGQWTRIQISQLMTGSSTTFSIKIGEADPLTKNNPTPKGFEAVKVYATDPWHTAQAGNIRGLKITTQ